MTSSRNELLLTGEVQEAPRFSHENHGRRFVRFPLAVPRLSGQVDLLPILLPEELAWKVEAGQKVEVRGQLRSYNNRSGVGNRLLLSVLAREIVPGGETAQNEALLSGVLCKVPIFRRTPLGRSICDLMLAVPRRYGRADYIPVIAWGQLAMETRLLEVGAPLSLEGRFQSRGYQKVTEAGCEERTALEVSMMHLLHDDAETAKAEDL